MSEYRFDNRDMDAPGKWRVMEGTSVPSWGSPRNIDIEIPGRFGVAEIAPETSGPCRVVIQVMIEGGTREALDANLRAFAVRVRRFRQLGKLEYTPKNSPTRVARARLTGSVEPTIDGGKFIADVALVFEIPSGIWRDSSDSVMSSTDLSKLDGGVMPIPDPVFLVSEVTGPVTITDTVSGSQIRFTGTVSSGGAVRITPAKYEARALTSPSWAATGTAASAELTISSGGFTLSPSIEAKHSLTTSGGTVQVRARRAF